VGLDVYLYSSEQAAANAEYSKASDEAFAAGPDGKSPWDVMTDEEKAAWRQRYSYTTAQDVQSERYPGHLFNRRYLRSSYNGGGFNHAVPEMIGTAGDSAQYPNERGSLYWIFEPMGREWDGDEGLLTAADIPKLRDCKARAEVVAEELRKADRLRVMTVSPNFLMAPPTFDNNDALRLYRAEVERRSIGPSDWYSSRDLEVFGDGLEVLAAVPGKATFDVPGVHLIYRQADDGFESYVQSAEITAEFCDEAIALIERDGSCEMHWSG
jgi:hypothetical protein